MSARVRGDLIARIPVVAYCRDAVGLGLLADSLRRGAYVRLEEATESLERLAEVAGRASRIVVVARLQELDDELADVIAQCEGLPLVLLVPNVQRVAIQALRAGAGAVLGTEADDEQLGAAVMSVANGLSALPSGAARFAEPLAALAPPLEPLTLREMEILSLLAGGDSNKTIAARLSISVHTVKFHISSILAKLGVASRTEAVALALRLGIVLL